MRLTIHRPTFLAACQLAGMAAPRGAREIKPVLRNLLAIGDADGVTLMATDLEVGLRLRIPGPVVDDFGEALLPAAKLTQILAELPDEQVAIDASRDSVKVTGAAAEFDMPGEDSSHFPPVPEADKDADRITLSAGILRDLFAKTGFATASVENSRFGATTGLRLEHEGTKTLVCVATDGRRLALATAQEGIALPANTKQACILPAKGVKLAQRLLDDPEELVSIEIRTNEVLLSTPRATLYMRQVEGRFPTWGQVMPKDSDAKTVATIAGSTLLTGMRQAAIMTDAETKRVVFTFAKPGKLTMQAKGSEVGKSKSEVLVGLAGPGVEIAFDPQFLGEFLKMAGGEEVTVRIRSGQDAAMFSVGDSYRYVVVPLVVSGG